MSYTEAYIKGAMEQRDGIKLFIAAIIIRLIAHNLVYVTAQVNCSELNFKTGKRSKHKQMGVY
jgi:hypothetical protein